MGSELTASGKVAAGIMLYLATSSVAVASDGAAARITLADLLAAAVAIVIVLLAVVVAYVVRESLAAKKAAEAAIRELDALLVKHRAALVRKYRQLVRKDDYGNILFDAWFKERDYFMEMVLEEELPSLFNMLDRDWIAKRVSEFTIDARYASDDYLTADIDSMSPVDFEHQCAAILEGAGWQTVLTPQSGDQGVDIVASKGCSSVAIQCKKYSRPVGNAAVQEVAAGRRFHSTDHAVVVSNVGFTPQAKALADSCGVRLLHFEELSGLADVLEIEM